MSLPDVTQPFGHSLSADPCWATTCISSYARTQCQAAGNPLPPESTTPSPTPLTSRYVAVYRLCDVCATLHREQCLVCDVRTSHTPRKNLQSRTEGKHACVRMRFKTHTRVFVWVAHVIPRTSCKPSIAMFASGLSVLPAMAPVSFFSCQMLPSSLPLPTSHTSTYISYCAVGCLSGSMNDAF